MQKIEISHLGPVTHCELEIKDFIVLTGPQASGKSTIAKCVFFFKNTKNLLLDQIVRQCTLGNVVTNTTRVRALFLEAGFRRKVCANFLQMFGDASSMAPAMELKYFYTEEIYIKIALSEKENVPGGIMVEFSPDLCVFLDKLEYSLRDMGDTASFKLDEVKNRIQDFFQDDAEIIYIPAGRSMITLLSRQLNYIYSSMDDVQKRNLDYCTQNYLERILRLKPYFSVSMDELVRETVSLTDTEADAEVLNLACDLTKRILEGEYRSVDGEERLLVSGDRYVRINYASSGQQEAVWILNVLFYYLFNNKKAYFIIEEPESHLFPNAQKLITEFIALAQCNHNQILITTHSPYVLGTVNNLLYADRISRIVEREALKEIVEAQKWISFSKLAAFFVEGGTINSCTDEEAEAIEHEVIDGASERINEDFEKMVLLKERALKKGGT